ncbi:MAG: 1-phosphofructokinase family hexose kinase [Candidatus Poribacteria bacterium]|nr:1-phosphofructokinase family hexose kinase [Candidatus Poribacteria bacterium]
MILTVTMNPCIDKTVYVTAHQHGGVNRSERVTRIAGGKGVNVARTVRALGENAVALVCVGGHAGRSILDMMADDGIPTVPVWLKDESRAVTTILEADSDNHAQTSYVEPGAPISPSARLTLFARYERLLETSSLVVLTGPAPDPTSTDIYAEMTRLAKWRGIPVFLDSRGDVFRRAVEEVPTLVKPNDAEAAEWLGVERIEDESDERAVVRKLRERGIEWVVLTLGARGALAAVGDVEYRAMPPRAPIVNPIGSGDAMLGAMAVAWTRGESVERIIRHGMAAGAANASVWDACGITPEQVEPLVDQVELSTLSQPPLG